MNQFCPIYFPTTVDFLDDEDYFLKSILVGLNSKGGLYKTHTDPRKLLEKLNAEVRLKPLEMNWIACEGNENLGHRVVDADITSLHKEAYRAERFDETAVVVVDYQMPEMSGIEFCSRLKNKNIYKVLLTGHTDDSLGIDALNKGIIHQFVRKHDSNLAEKLKGVIRLGQRHFFAQATARTLKTLEGDSIFWDPVYLDLVERVCKQLNVVEYYLIDTQGSLLLFDDLGKEYTLFIASDNQLDSLAYIATEIGAPEDVIKSFKNRTKIFCKYTEDGKVWPDAILWQNYLHKAKVVVGKRPIYYALTSNCFEIDRQKVRVFGSK